MNKSQKLRFNPNVFIAAAEAVDSGIDIFEFSCNAIMFTNQSYRLVDAGIEPVERMDGLIPYAHMTAYGELMASEGRDRICAGDVIERSKGVLQDCRKHRVLMLLIAAQVLGGKVIPRELLGLPKRGVNGD